MTFPDNSIMFLLLAIQNKRPLEPVDGTLTLHLTDKEGDVVVRNLDTELDELEDRGWVEIREPYPVLTEQGAYALDRFMKERYGKRAVAMLRAIRAGQSVRAMAR